MNLGRPLIRINVARALRAVRKSQRDSEPPSLHVPFIDYQGPFRLSAGMFHYSKSLNFATLPRNATVGGQRSESLSFTSALSTAKGEP